MLDRSAIESAAQERAREEARTAALDLGMGSAFGLAVFLGTALFLAFVLLGIPGIGTRWALVGGFALAGLFMSLGTWLEPAANWNRATYKVAGGGTEGHDPYQVAGGIHAGMPLGTLMSDPENIQARTGVLASGCANFLLGGPRQIRRGWAALSRARSLRDPASVGTAVLFLDWVGTRQSIAESELESGLAKRPDLAAGLAILVELRLARLRRDGTVRALQIMDSQLQ